MNKKLLSSISSSRSKNQQMQKAFENKIMNSFAPYRLKDYGIETPVLPPHTVDLMVGISVCNQKCFGCPGKDTSGQSQGNILNREEWKNVLGNILSFIVEDQFVKEFHLSHNWSDPLMSPFFGDIIDTIRADNKYRDIHVITNGMLAQRKLGSLVNTDVVNISMNATSSQTYKSFHGVDGYERALRGAYELRKLAELANKGLKIRTSLVLRDGLIKNLPDHMKRLQDSGFDGICIRQDFFETNPQKRERLAREIFEYAQLDTPIPMIIKGFGEAKRDHSPICQGMRYWATVDFKGTLKRCMHNTNEDYGLAYDLVNTPMQSIWNHMYRHGVANNGRFNCTSHCCPSTLGMLNGLDYKDIQKHYKGASFEDLKILDEFTDEMIIQKAIPKAEITMSSTARDFSFSTISFAKKITTSDGKDLGVIVDNMLFDNSGKLIATGTQEKKEIVFKRTEIKGNENPTLCRICDSNTEKGKKIFVDAGGSQFAYLTDDVIVEYNAASQSVTAMQPFTRPSEQDRDQAIQEIKKYKLTQKEEQKLSSLVKSIKEFRLQFPRSIIINPIPGATVHIQSIDLSKWVAFNENEIKMTNFENKQVSYNGLLQEPGLTTDNYEKAIKNFYLQYKALNQVGLLKKELSIEEIIDNFNTILTAIKDRFERDYWSYEYITEKLHEPIFIDTVLRLSLQRNLSAEEQMNIVINPELYQDFKEQKTSYDIYNMTGRFLSTAGNNHPELMRKLLRHEASMDDIYKAFDIVKANDPDYEVPEWVEATKPRYLKEAKNIIF